MKEGIMPIYTSYHANKNSFQSLMYIHHRQTHLLLLSYFVFNTLQFPVRKYVLTCNSYLLNAFNTHMYITIPPRAH